jgi:hypothetical protein
MGRDQRVRPGSPQVRAELLEVRAIRLERVAGEAALELQVGQEVEQQVLEGLRRDRDRHGRESFAAAPGRPAQCNAPVTHAASHSGAFCLVPTRRRGAMPDVFESLEQAVAGPMDRPGLSRRDAVSVG